MFIDDLIELITNDNCLKNDNNYRKLDSTHNDTVHYNSINLNNVYTY